ncbi:MAG: hypothetical protein KAR47_17620 [Planctomycetes bacterium]|nr:hypothetical protein [Planctomycetota bacterium]
MLKKILYASVGLLVLVLIFFGYAFYRVVNKRFEVSYFLLSAQACRTQLEGIGQLIEVYRSTHDGNSPIDFNTLLSDESVVSAKGVFGVPKNGLGVEYRTRQERLKEMLVCTYDNKHACSYAYIGSGIKADDPNDIILAYEKPGNHVFPSNKELGNNARYLSVLFNGNDPRVRSVTNEELIELIKTNNDIRKEHGLTIK